MPLTAGQQLSHYEILGRLGEGGMGVVYKARDVNLQRPVAIKVLPAEWVRDTDRKRRFIQEAQAASALNHPGIVTIHEIAQQDGMDFIAMEFVEGKTLAELIGRKGLRLNDVLSYATQAANALAKAHASGIVHRDLKPSNVMVTDDGRLKILDFGLAKLVATDNPAGESDVETRTMAARDQLETAAGKVVGTVAYMSPEQAQGKKVDSRSDIFSFGSMLYEMTTGARAFQCSSSAETLGAVVNREPQPPGQLRKDLPRALERAILRCLRKDPTRRFQSMADLAIELDEIKAESDNGMTAVVAQGGVRSRRGLVIGAAVVALAGAGAVWMRPSRGGAGASATMLGPLTSFAHDETSPTFSPDGTQVAFAWDGENGANRDIYLMPVGATSPLRLTTNPAPDSSPTWSPDGTGIAFTRPEGNGLAIFVSTPPLVDSERRLAVVAADRAAGGFSERVSWFPDSRHLTAVDLAEGMTGIVQIGPEPTRRILWTPVSDGEYRFPAVSQTGRALAYAQCRATFSCHVYVVDLSDQLSVDVQPRRLTRQPQIVSGIAWAADGRSVIFGLQAEYISYLWRAAADGSSLDRIDLAGDRASYPAVSSRGNLLAYEENGRNVDLWRFHVGSPTKDAIASSQRYENAPNLSPDGSRIVFESNRTGRLVVFTANADGSNARPLMQPDSALHGAGSARWSPDGRRITFDAGLPSGQPGVFVVGADGSGSRLVAAPGSVPAWSADGQAIYFTRAGSVWRTPVDRDAPERVVENARNAIASPDGRFLYYRRLGPPEALYARDVAGGPERRIVEGVSTAVSTFAPFNDGVFYLTDPKPQSTSRELRFFELATGRDRLVQSLDRAISAGLSLSQDRQTIYTSGSDPAAGTDLVLIRNFR